MVLYHLDDPKSTKSAASRQSAAHSDRPPSFSAFCGRRSFPPVPVSREIRPARRVYLALPLAFFDCPIADQAIALASQYAEEVFDPRGAFTDNADWRKRCGGILCRCDAFFGLLTPDRELSSGVYSEAAYAYALGLPVHVISWRLRGKPKLELGGEIVPVWDWDWTWWRAAQYRSPGMSERLEFRESATRAKTMSAAAWAALRVRLPWPKEKAAG